MFHLEVPAIFFILLGFFFPHVAQSIDFQTKWQTLACKMTMEEQKQPPKSRWHYVIFRLSARPIPSGQVVARINFEGTKN